MGKIPTQLRETIARNIRACRMRMFPGRDGGKKCAAAFGVSPQQWSPWERGMRTPDELRLMQLAQFFGVTVEYLRRDNHAPQTPQEPERPSEPPPDLPGGGSFAFMPPPATTLSAGSSGGKSGANTGAVYVPVFVLLPYLPEDMKTLYDQFNAAMNGGKPSAPPSA